MIKRILNAVVLAALLTPLVFSQTTATTPTPPTPEEIAANQVARLTKLLDLTTAQQTLATPIFTDEQTALAALKTDMDTAQTALQAAVEANSLSAITAAAGIIGDLTTQQILAQAKAGAAFYAILTSDQQSKYNELRLALVNGLGGGGRRGPGGPGGPGGSGGSGGPPKSPH
jgi:Spy/CpxP family protein refolding chaperone